MTNNQQIRVADNAAAHRYEILVGERVVGFVTYRLTPDQRMVLTHTEIDEAHEGQGLGRHLAASTLDDARRRGLSVTPVCPFIAAYMRRNPEYADLLDAAHRH